MARAHVVATLGNEHVHGTIETTSWPLDGSKSEVLIHLDDGRQLLVPYAGLSRQEDSSYVFTLSTDEIDHGQVESSTVAEQDLVIPVMAEELDVHKRQIETGRVRITKVVHEHEELVNEPLFREEVTIERVPMNRFVDAPIPLRYEGDTIIVSLLEEVAVVEKRLMLKEELRITRRQVEDHKPLPVVLRREEANVEHIGPDGIDKKNL
jgi:uncharacterized protein (TIGR02271 family)